MSISARFIKMQLELFKAFSKNCDIDTERIGQSVIGELMSGAQKGKVVYQPVIFRDSIGEWIAPKQQTQDGVILYLHGGGYVAGDIDYARGFGTILAARNNIKVFCSAYRLAPENPFPAALEDALTAYNFLLQSGYSEKNIILCGESAGGGLCYCLLLKLKELGKKLPCGVIAISPWTDLGTSGASYSINESKDPSMTREKLQFYASLYAPGQTDNPLVSPLKGELAGFPPSLIFVGGDEVMLDDSTALHRELLRADCKSELITRPGMWHAYVLYGIKETRADHALISSFILRNLNINSWQ